MDSRADQPDFLPIPRALATGSSVLGAART
jgi:hypothetical protein